MLDATDEHGMPFTASSKIFCPCHYINECKERVNVCFLDGPVVNQIWVVSTKEIAAGDELFVVYGGEVDRAGWDKPVEEIKVDSNELVNEYNAQENQQEADQNTMKQVQDEVE